MEDMEDNKEKATSSEKVMVKVVQTAVEYLVKALKATDTQIKPQSLRLEETKGSATSTEWTLTLSYIDASTENPLATLYGGSNDSRRIYKIITVAVSNEAYDVVSIEERIK